MHNNKRERERESNEEQAKDIQIDTGFSRNIVIIFFINNQWKHVLSSISFLCSLHFPFLSPLKQNMPIVALMDNSFKLTDLKLTIVLFYLSCQKTISVYTVYKCVWQSSFTLGCQPMNCLARLISGFLRRGSSCMAGLLIISLSVPTECQFEH